MNGDVTLSIKWPSGATQTIRNISEGEAESRVDELRRQGADPLILPARWFAAGRNTGDRN